MKKLYVEPASLVGARLACMSASANESQRSWASRHEDTINTLVENHMPSGSGFDCGTTIDLDASTDNKLVFNTSYHHKHDSGMYAGWTEHTVTVTVTPSLQFGFDLRISGRDRNGWKDYAYEVFQSALSTEV